MRNIKRKEEGVSPVIATILMVAITVVLAATLYMMLPSGSDTDTTEALSGRVRDASDGWIVEIDSGSVSYGAGKVIMYNKSSGASFSDSGNDYESTDENVLTLSDDNELKIIFNDNDDNDDINGGDTFKLEFNPNDSNTMSQTYFEDNFQFRVEGTNLQEDLG